MELRPKHERFVLEYLKDLNATQAAIRAGYSRKTAGVQGHDLLKNPKIAAAIAEKNAEKCEKAGLTAELVRETLARALRFDPSDTVDAEGNALMVNKIPDHARLALAGHERKPIFHEGVPVGETVAVKYPDKLSAAMGAAKLLGMLVDKVESKADVTVRIEIGGIVRESEDDG